MVIGCCFSISILELDHDLFQGLDHLLFSIFTAPTPRDAVADDGLPFRLGQVEGVLDGAVIVQDVPSKVRRVVAVDAEPDTGLEVLPDGQVGDPLDAPQLDVAERAQGDEDPTADKLGHDVVAGLEQLDAVVDPLDVQLPQGLGHVGHAGLLPRVGRAAEPAPLGVQERLPEQGRGVPQFGAAQPETPDDSGFEVREGRGLVHRPSVPGGEVPQDAHDELRGQAEVGQGPRARRLESTHDGRVLDPPRGVGLRVEKDLGVRHAVGRGGPREVGVREGLKVGRGHQDRHADEIIVQEIVEGRESSIPGEKSFDGLERRVHRRRRKFDVVTFGQGEE